MAAADTQEIDPTDAVALAQALVRRPSVTPDAADALELLEGVLAPAGFVCARVERGGVRNLYARLGAAGPVFGFNGHVDVVPTGDPAAWTRPPFSGEIADGLLWGRGSVDMKSGVAAFVAAALRLSAQAAPPGAIALLITGDEEGDAVDGTAALLDWMAERGERLDVCLVGEPTSKETLGDQMKIGRRGSLTAYIAARGRQGHTAYPQAAANPAPALVRLLDQLAAQGLDKGNAHFEPSTLAITTIDIGNPANNVIPERARATVNIRYNNRHDAVRLEAWLRHRIERVARDPAFAGVSFEMTTKRSGDAFLTEPGPWTEMIAGAVSAETGVTPVASTGGGTSDARFVKNHCPVVEFGLVGKGMHQVDEAAAIAEISALSGVYERLMGAFFAAGGL